jgi:hypothetical protein
MIVLQSTSTLMQAKIDAQNSHLHEQHALQNPEVLQLIKESL